MSAHPPATRADCIDGPRPCPHYLCRHHMLIERKLSERGHGGRVREKLQSPPWLPGWKVSKLARHADTLGEALALLPGTCSLDLAAYGQRADEDLGQLFGVTKQRADQMVKAALVKLTNALAEDPQLMEELKP